MEVSYKKINIPQLKPLFMPFDVCRLSCCSTTLCILLFFQLFGVPMGVEEGTLRRVVFMISMKLGEKLDFWIEVSLADVFKGLGAVLSAEGEHSLSPWLVPFDMWILLAKNSMDSLKIASFGGYLNRSVRVIEINLQTHFCYPTTHYCISYHHLSRCFRTDLARKC